MAARDRHARFPTLRSSAATSAISLIDFIFQWLAGQLMNGNARLRIITSGQIAFALFSRNFRWLFDVALAE